MTGAPSAPAGAILWSWLRGPLRRLPAARARRAALVEAREHAAHREAFEKLVEQLPNIHERARWRFAFDLANR